MSSAEHLPILAMSSGSKHFVQTMVNGVTERMNRTLLNLARSMLHHKGIDRRFWAEAISTAVYIRNRVTSRALPPNTTPHHIWYKSVPNVSHLRVFGSKCWLQTWDSDLMKFVVSRDVKFQEADTADELSISLPPSITKPPGSGSDIGKDEPLQCQMDSKLKKETLDTHDASETQPDEATSPKP
eukprot:IDg22901t1